MLGARNEVDGFGETDTTQIEGKQCRTYLMSLSKRMVKQGLRVITEIRNLFEVTKERNI